MNNLLDEHRESLRKTSLISDEVINRAGLFSLNGEDSRRVFEIDFGLSGICFSYLDLDGNHIGYRLRKDNCDKHGKYFQRKGDKLPLYFLKDQILKIKNNEIPLVLTEGEKKGLCVISNLIGNYAVVAIPGCWNYKDSIANDIHEIIKQIPVLNRKIIFLGDSDFFSNPNVFNAYIYLIKYLYEMGADVSLVDLRNGDEKEKIGVDDFIYKYGVDKLKERIEKPFWRFKKFCPSYLDSLRICPKNEIVKEVLKATILERDLVIIFELFETLKERFKINLGITHKVRNELLKDFKKIEPKNEIVGNDIFHNQKTDTIYTISELIATKLASINEIFYEPVSNCFIEKRDGDESFKYISTPTELASVLGRIFNYHLVENNKQGERVIIRQDHIPEKILSTIYSNPLKLAKFKELNFISKCPVFINNNLISNFGYSESGKVFVDCESIATRNNQFHLNKILSSFPFENQSSKENALAFIISQSMFLNEFIGTHPGVIISGDTPNLGKTTLAQVASIISQGNEISTSKFSLNNDDENEKNIASQVQNSNVIIFDNIRANSQMISSSCLERAITDKMMSFRRLGKNSMIKRLNNFQFIFTLNGGTFSEDLLIRNIPIFLTEKSEQKIDYSFDVVEYTKKYRKEILGEIIGMVELWQSKGSLPINKNFPKFSKWASVMGGILSDSGYVNFLDNFENAQVDLNPIINSILSYCFEKMELDKKKFVNINAGQLINLNGINENEDFVGLSLKSKQTKIGKLLKKLCGKSFQFKFDDQVRSIFIEEVASSDGGNNRQYRIKDVTSVTSSKLILLEEKNINEDNIYLNREVAKKGHESDLQNLLCESFTC